MHVQTGARVVYWADGIAHFSEMQAYRTKAEAMFMRKHRCGCTLTSLCYGHRNEERKEVTVLRLMRKLKLQDDIARENNAALQVIL